MAVPLSCPDNHAISLVGAVLAAGGGPRPTVSPSWLREWACEMAKTLAHASVQLMEVGGGPAWAYGGRACAAAGLCSPGWEMLG